MLCTKKLKSIPISIVSHNYPWLIPIRIADNSCNTLTNYNLHNNTRKKLGNFKKIETHQNVNQRKMNDIWKQLDEKCVNFCEIKQSITNKIAQTYGRKYASEFVAPSERKQNNNFKCKRSNTEICEKLINQKYKQLKNNDTNKNIFKSNFSSSINSTCEYINLSFLKKRKIVSTYNSLINKYNNHNYNNHIQVFPSPDFNSNILSKDPNSTINNYESNMNEPNEDDSDKNNKLLQLKTEREKLPKMIKLSNNVNNRESSSKISTLPKINQTYTNEKINLPTNANSKSLKFEKFKNNSKKTVIIKSYKYSDPFYKIPKEIQQRVNHISQLEFDTIRYEKLKKKKKY
ncbi:hypothetical protein A3Q56_03816 [Intoshia linei]|uniref:Uncharacterized protein n=1 Tax=Intoshia linei TaxID=1819745 RepID=A0A177B415_9BILA|nr:hypothetical protein A3Q56_03816 [Intoshia linei]